MCVWSNLGEFAKIFLLDINLDNCPVVMSVSIIETTRLLATFTSHKLVLAGPSLFSRMFAVQTSTECYAGVAQSANA